MRFSLILSTVICFVFFSSSYAQENKNSYYWLNLGIGKTIGPTFNSGISYEYKENVFSFRFIYSDELQWGVDSNSDVPALRVRDIGLLYGRSLRKDILRLGLSAGIGYINGIKRGSQLSTHQYEELRISNIGFPLEGNIRLDITKNISIGGSYIANFNSKETYSGVLFGLYVGSLR